jgi:hypothetical protein
MSNNISNDKFTIDNREKLLKDIEKLLLVHFSNIKDEIIKNTENIKDDNKEMIDHLKCDFERRVDIIVNQEFARENIIIQVPTKTKKSVKPIASSHNTDLEVNLNNISDKKNNITPLIFLQNTFKDKDGELKYIGDLYTQDHLNEALQNDELDKYKPNTVIYKKKLASTVYNLTIKNDKIKFDRLNSYKNESIIESKAE